MPELAQKFYPETTHKIISDEFIKAVKGEWAPKAEWFFKQFGARIKFPEISLSLRYPQQMYIVVRDSEIILPDNIYSLPLINIDYKTSKKVGFVFYNCILPDVDIHKCKFNEWVFVNSVAGDMLFNNGELAEIKIEQSKVGSLGFNDHSECRNIRLRMNSEIDFISFSNNSKCNMIELHEGSVCGDIDVDSNSRIDKIEITKNSLVGDIAVDGQSKSGHIILGENSTFEKISIKGKSAGGDIIIRDNSAAGGLLIDENSSIEKIEIIERSQCGNVSVLSNSQSESIEVDGYSQTGNIEVKNSRVLQLKVSNNYCSVYLYNANVPLMRFVDCCLHELEWSAGTKGELYIDGGKINYLKLFKTALLKDAILSLNNTQIFVVQLQELVVQGQLIFRNIVSAVMPFLWNPGINQNFSPDKAAENTNGVLSAIYGNKAGLNLKQKEKYKSDLENLQYTFDARKMPLFCIIDSSLGKTEITGSDLSKFNFEYRDSKLLETFFSGTKLPKNDIKIYNQEAAGGIKYFEQKVSIYNQLKKIFENQGDIVEATWYHSKAMNNQASVLKIAYLDSKKWISEQLFDLIRFWLNKITNNHGESWWRALKFILFISLTMYSLYYTSLHYQESFSVKATDRFFRNYIIFLDPTHKIDFHIPKVTLGVWQVLFDLLGRILIAYGIYQFIAAFRKHTRKAG
jgi:hypothetical protein